MGCEAEAMGLGTLTRGEYEPGLWTKAGKNKPRRRNAFLGFVFLPYLLSGGLCSTLSELPF